MQSELIEALKKLRANFDAPSSDMAIIRQTLRDKISRLESPEMPPILSQDKREVILKDIDLLEEFLCTDDGNDAISLLMATWNSFVESRKPADPQPAETLESEQQS